MSVERGTARGAGIVVVGRGDGPGDAGPLATLLAARLVASGAAAEAVPAGAAARPLPAGSREAAVILPRRHRGVPDPAAVASTVTDLRAGGVRRIVLAASTEVYEAHHHHPGMVAETTGPVRAGANPVARSWLAVEERAAAAARAAGVALTVLRAAPVPLRGGDDLFSHLLAAPLACTVAGHDPVVQLLHVDDLAAAVLRALAVEAPGPFNVVPAAVAPLRKALRAAGRRRLPVPRWVQRAARASAGRWWGVPGAAAVESLRYPFTAGGERAARELGFTARRSTAAAAAAATGRPPPVAPPADDFGFDPEVVAAHGRLLFRFLHDVYWRVEWRGLEALPQEGPVVLTGVHRGFMPFDGVMALHLLVRETGRAPRFLLHPTLLKFPFLFDFMTRLGGVPACRENADRILGAGGVLGIYPEGIRGAFTPYRRAYRLGKFGRDEYVRMALRNRAPIVPFVTVGSAEIFPILGRVDWSWWKRWTEWPYLPLTPTFPWLPLPLPSKWHTRFLAPLHVEADHGPEAADDPRVVAAISAEVRRRMRAAFDGMLARRRSVFRGSVFDGEGDGGGADPVGGDGGAEAEPRVGAARPTRM